MCGFAGYLTTPGSSIEASDRSLLPMIRCLAHRGPDQEGTWLSADHGIAMGFRRLAIVDLSAEGHQPMRSATGRYVMTFNGEVYNFGEIRAELSALGHSFRGHSDTEVILASFEEWGIEASLPRFNGMFAIAVWDTQRQTLSLARDRIGIKPLYVYRQPGYVSYGSELKALVAGPAFERAIDLDSVQMYLRYLYVPAPATIYRGALKLLPGCLLTIRSPAESLPEPLPFWSLGEARARADEAGLYTDEEAADRLEELLADSVRLRMIADVPLGALLSGGVDSSTVVALMQEQSSRRVKTFTIGFDSGEHDESHHARAVAGHLGTDHTELMLTGADALDVIERLPEMFDEPHADPSQIPTFLVSRLARSEVTVALSGDGGDELFAGYNRYRFGEKVIGGALRVPEVLRRWSGNVLSAVGPAASASAYRAAMWVAPGQRAHRLAEDKVRKIGDLLGAGGEPHMYRSLMSVWQRPEALVPGSGSPVDRADNVLAAKSPAPLLDRMMLADQTTYLPDDLLAKVDRASMAVSLEARVPILDHRIVELSWRMSRTAKLREGVTKWALREVLYRRVPRHLIERPKTGFSVPIDAWLAGPLQDWAGDLLSRSALERSGVLDPQPIQDEWAAFRAGRGSGLAIWSVLMFQAWHARWS